MTEFLPGKRFSSGKSKSRLSRGVSYYFPDQGSEPLEPPIKAKQINLFRLAAIIILAVIFARLIQLQVVQGEDYRVMAEGNRIRIQRIRAQRGLIYSQEGKPLVENIPSFSLTVTPGDLPEEERERKELLAKVSSLAQLNEEEQMEIDNLPPNSYRSYLIKNFLPYEEALQLKLQLADLPGWKINVVPARHYLAAEYFSHLLGYIGKISPQELEEHPDYYQADSIGKTGLEQEYEAVLKGQEGQKRIEVSGLGKEERVIGEEAPQSGDNLILTVDYSLQKKLYEVLNRYVRQSYPSSAGAGIILNPHSGEILALVSIPAYDNNLVVQGEAADWARLSRDPHYPLINRCLSGQYPSGSLIKPLLAAAGLEEGIINRWTTVFSRGGIQIGRWFYPDWKEGGHGTTDLIKAIAESVNTFFYYLGGGYGDFAGLGLDKIREWSEKFGLASPSGIDLPGEKSGFLPTREWKRKTEDRVWSIGDTYHLSIGQGDLLVTPLQIADMTAVFANGGKLVRPYLVKEIVDHQGKVKEETVPQIVREDFISPDNLELVRQGLKAAVDWGSAVRLSTLLVDMAGKTGTAQVGGYQDPHAWFTGFAPYERPEIVITVLMENGGEGSRAGVSIAQEVLQYYFSREQNNS